MERDIDRDTDRDMDRDRNTDRDTDRDMDREMDKDTEKDMDKGHRHRHRLGHGLYTDMVNEEMAILPMLQKPMNYYLNISSIKEITTKNNMTCKITC